MPEFFDQLKLFSRHSDEGKFWLTSVDPDPETYFGKHFDYWGAWEFFLSDSSEDYLSALNDFPKENLADAFACNTEAILLTSPSCYWAIYADREFDIALCGFTSSGIMDQFKQTFSPSLLQLDAAANHAFAYVDDEKRHELVSRFIRNYS